MLPFIFIYSLFLSIPLPYLSQPPSALALFLGTGQHPSLPSDKGWAMSQPLWCRRCHWTRYFFLSSSPERDSLPLSPFPCCEMLPVLGCMKEQKNPHPSTLRAQRGPCCPCCITPPSRPGGYLGLSCLPGLPTETCKWKTDAERALPGVEAGRLGRLCAGCCVW